MDIEISIIISRIRENEYQIQIKEKVRTVIQTKCCQYYAETLKTHQVEDLNRDRLEVIIAEE